MSTPIVEQIALKLVELVNEITIANGFNQNLTAVRPKRLHLESDLNTDGTVIIEQEDGAVAEDGNEINVMIQAFTLQALIIDSDDATSPIDTRLNQAAADIIKKIFTGDNYNLGGYADRAILIGTEKFIPDPQVAGIAININVMYEVKTDDPYTLG